VVHLRPEESDRVNLGPHLPSGSGVAGMQGHLSRVKARQDLRKEVLYLRHSDSLARRPSARGRHPRGHAPKSGCTGFRLSNPCAGAGTGATSAGERTPCRPSSRVMLLSSVAHGSVDQFCSCHVR
jgi:hypothetical protein